MTLIRIFPPLLALLSWGCIHVKTDPIEVRPIHITVDVNVKVERALEDFFGELDQRSETIKPAQPVRPQ